ncbi:MAG: hypothetical protein QOJ94_2610 [Sphingomonadales bacterium]|jgi:hypothetical protein|nr:hypothetical protein [Sphingomonadales bacterium]
MAAGDDRAVERIAGFLARIAIPLWLEPAGDGLLPGLTVRDGGIVADPERLLYPGDLLHEAGHIAVTEPARRPTLSQVSDDPGEEMAAIAWSWAAAAELGLDPEVVFHADGYRGGSATIIEAFASRRGFGVPLLACWGMTEESLFPRMIRWLR